MVRRGLSRAKHPTPMLEYARATGEGEGRGSPNRAGVWCPRPATKEQKQQQRQKQQGRAFTRGPHALRAWGELTRGPAKFRPQLSETIHHHGTVPKQDTGANHHSPIMVTSGCPRGHRNPNIHAGFEQAPGVQKSLDTTHPQQNKQPYTIILDIL